MTYAADNDFAVKAMTFSPIKGPEGNIEYLSHLVSSDTPVQSLELQGLVDASHEALEGTT